MRIDKSLQWIEPYLRSVDYLLPKMKKIRRIKACTESLKKCAQFAAQLSRNDKGQFVLSIYTKCLVTEKYTPDFVMREVQRPKITILEYLAHELSHLEHWEHTPEHQKLQNLICSIFMDKLKESGYESMEKELEDSENT